MKPNCIFFIAIFLSTGICAQKQGGAKVYQGASGVPYTPSVLPNSQPGNSVLGGGNCDTINYPVPGYWNITAYYSHANGTETMNGFVTGENGFGETEKAASFNASSSAGKYLSKVWIRFAAANSSLAAHLTKVVPIHIYDGTNGTPGAVLATVNKTLADLKADVLAKRYTEVSFAAAVTLPLSKKFYVSVDLNNLVWNDNPAEGQDSLGIYSSDPNHYEPGPEANGFGWEKAGLTWQSFSDGWGRDFALVVHPIICTESVLPVRLLSFTASRQGNTNVINWTTATESGNAGFTLQRSYDGISFTNLANISSHAQGGNSSIPLTYSYNDSKGITSNNYYRLVQTDMAGNQGYSSIINVKAAVSQTLQIANAWPSPATSYIKLLISSPSNEEIQLSVVDVSGKVVSQKMQQLSAGENTVVLYINQLAPGTYFIKAGNSHASSVIRKFTKD